MTKKPNGKPTNIELSCTEIGGLWSSFIQESMTVCFLNYFLHHLQDEEIVPIAQEALKISEQRISKIKSIFLAENFPIPAGFSEGDVKERNYWDDYQRAYEEMLSNTSTEEAPWYVVPADRKWFTRVVVSDVIVEKLESLKLDYPKLDGEQLKALDRARKILETE